MTPYCETEVLEALWLRIQVVWNGMLCCWVSCSQCSERCSLCLQESQKNVLLTAEDEGTVFFANTGNHSPNTTKSHPRKLTFLILYATEWCDKEEAVYDAWLVYADSGAINKWWIEN